MNIKEDILLQIIKERVSARSKWTSFIETEYKDRNNNTKTWSFIRRNNETKAVVIIPRTAQTGDLILIRQYRIPLGGYAIEFPAGLIDKNESIEQAAIRELIEETGYKGDVHSVSPPLCTSAGLASEIVYLATVQCEEECSFKPKPDASEVIDVIRMPIEKTMSQLQKFAEQGDIIDSRIVSYLTSFEYK